MEFRRTVPAGQFCLFTVTIVDYIISCKRMFQTFGDAFDYIQKYADGAEIFEVKSDSFSVQYTFLSHDIKHSIHFATVTIDAHLFTYDADKPLVTSNFMWTYEDERSPGHLQ